MAQVINTNMQSLNAQRNLATSQKMLGNTLERLSTGLRINSAKDDAAGLAISERFTSQIKGLNQAMRNANDGVSFTQTAEASLSTIGANMQRIRELAVQSTNASNSAGDRTALDNEVQGLLKEIQRVALNTEFNGRAILDGSDSANFFQVGSNQGQMISISGVNSKLSALGNQEIESVASYTTEELRRMESQGVTVGSVTIQGLGGAGKLASGISFSSASASSLEEAVSNINKAIQDEIDKGGTTGEGVADANLRAFLRVGNDGETSLVITGDHNTNTSGAGVAQFKVSGGSIGAQTGQASQFGETNLWASAKTAGVQTLEDLDIMTRETATDAMGRIDGALNQINALRAEIGATQVRFEQTISSLSVSSDNMSAARSRIRDADFAAETAELTRVQILQQAGISVLSQANSSPQSALALLQ
ncbi:flagellin N-terminal helical domain-containing protein [Thiorhodovibrio frisius]|uniref:Flagellin n=1 Tax=Thiorhodovibrio frisius TaxID=631362 RepID=H8Z5B0_9GAMM|nr:flagellin [Thiorhodovibrio frisius]EIC20517.1 flagellin/flagellar hook associated protein [Thiorhodovibrio frisius]WPL21261.1 A-type flagellin [Thiorhodovibrio frisius]